MQHTPLSTGAPEAADEAGHPADLRPEEEEDMEEKLEEEDDEGDDAVVMYDDKDDICDDRDEDEDCEEEEEDDDDDDEDDGGEEGVPSGSGAGRVDRSSGGRGGRSGSGRGDSGGGARVIYSTCFDGTILIPAYRECEYQIRQEQKKAPQDTTPAPPPPPEVLRVISAFTTGPSSLRLSSVNKALREYHQPTAIKIHDTSIHDDPARKQHGRLGLLRQMGVWLPEPEPPQDLGLSERLAGKWRGVRRAEVNVQAYKGGVMGMMMYGHPDAARQERESHERHVARVSRFLEAAAQALVHWKQLQSVKLPFSFPITSTLVQHCSQLTHMELDDGAFRRPSAGATSAQAVSQDSQFLTQHVAPSLQLLSQCSTLRTLKMVIESLPWTAAQVKLLGSFTQLHELDLTLLGKDDPYDDDEYEDDEDDAPFVAGRRTEINLAGMCDIVRKLLHLKRVSLTFDNCTITQNWDQKAWDLSGMAHLESISLLHKGDNIFGFPACSSLAGCTQLTRLVVDEDDAEDKESQGFANSLLPVVIPVPVIHQLPQLVHVQLLEIKEVDVLHALTRCRLKYLKAHEIDFPKEFQGVFEELQELDTSKCKCDVMLAKAAPKLLTLKAWECTFSLKLFAGHESLQDLEVPPDWFSKKLITRHGDDDPCGLKTVTSLSSLDIRWMRTEKLLAHEHLLYWPNITHISFGNMGVFGRGEHTASTLAVLDRVPNLRVFKWVPLWMLTAKEVEALVAAGTKLAELEHLKVVEVMCRWNPDALAHCVNGLPYLAALLVALAGSKSLTEVRLLLGKKKDDRGSLQDRMSGSSTAPDDPELAMMQYIRQSVTCAKRKKVFAFTLSAVDVVE